MKPTLLCFLLLLALTGQAQDIYESYQVDKPGEPQGGAVMLQLFLRSNLNVPLKAQAARVNGRVFVSGVIEPDGKLSSVTVVRGLRPDCDHEAMRVFSLFNAWVPARKDGHAVRQRVNYPITFASSPFIYLQNGNLIQYYTNDGQPVADTEITAVYQQITPIDTLTGLPTAARLINERNGTRWRESTRFRLSRIPIKTEEKDPALERSQLVFVDKQGRYSQTMYTLYPNGSVAVQAGYQNGTPTGDRQEYAPNGMLEATEVHDETTLGTLNPTGQAASQRVVATRTHRTTWHPNGQIKSIDERSAPVPGMPPPPIKLLSLWDSAGTALVTDGTGQAIYSDQRASRREATQKTMFVESGLVRDGLKEGVWTGQYADGSYRYTETYQAGICQHGTSEANAKEHTYNAIEQNPEPTGGMQALGTYLAQTMRYPPDAQRAGIQGKVFISFVVNTDGSIADVQVLKGLGPGCDNEAIRVVKNMPRWKPGIQRGEPVRVKFTMPLSFTLQ